MVAPWCANFAFTLFSVCCVWPACSNYSKSGHPFSTRGADQENSESNSKSVACFSDERLSHALVYM